MTKREAKRLVCGVAAAMLRIGRDNGDDWLAEDHDGNPVSPKDCDRILEAVTELADELEARS